MKTNLKFRFRMYRRKRVFYVEDIQTGQQESLHTKDPAEAARLLNAKNETTFLAGSDLHVARAYMIASDPHMPARSNIRMTWAYLPAHHMNQPIGGTPVVDARSVSS